MNIKKIKRILSMVLIFVFIFSSVINIEILSIKAAEGNGKQDLIGRLYEMFKDDSEKRTEILKVLIDTENLKKPYILQEITDSNVSEIANNLISLLEEDSVSTSSVEFGLKEFYKFQQGRGEIASIMLEKFKEGFQISNDKYDESFPNIKIKIEDKLNSYILFINLLQEAKDLYNEVKGKEEFNFIYKNTTGKITLYPDMETYITVGETFFGEDLVGDYVALMMESLDEINSNDYDNERKNFIKNLDLHLLIDLIKRGDTADPDDPGEPDEPGGPSGPSGPGRKQPKPPIQVVGPDQPITPPGQTSVSFTDIDSVPWAKVYIESLVDKGILAGVGEGKFEPDRNVTREEFAKMLIEAFALMDDTATTDMEDVKIDEWYYKYVATAQKLGIVQGVGDNRFGVGSSISRQDMAVMAYRAAYKAGATIVQEKTIENFTDSDIISQYATEAITIMQQADVINGMGDGTFSPLTSATRAQAAKVIYLLYTMWV